MNLQDYRTKIAKLISLFVQQVKASTAINHTDINKIAEDVLIPMFVVVHGYHNLSNMNHTERMNFPGIDLADDNARVAFQITSTANINKVKKTLREFIDGKLYEKYDRLIIYNIAEKQASYSEQPIKKIVQGKFAFDHKKDIQDYTDLLRDINKLEIDATAKVLKILEQHFGPSQQLGQLEGAADSPKLELHHGGSLNDALQAWQEKVVCLEKALAITADAAQQFQLRKQIAECYSEIQRLLSRHQQQPTMSIDRDGGGIIEQFDNTKRKEFEKRRTALVEQYKAAHRQLRGELSAVYKVRLEAQIEELEREIRQLEEELKRLNG